MKPEAYQKEILRYQSMYEYEQQCYKDGYKLIAGIDEAGRGPLAGSVVAAAVVLPEDIFIEGLNDSKKLSPKKRELLYDIIINQAVSYGIGIVDEKCIDEINILNATKKAMCKALEGLNCEPDILLIDAVEIDVKTPQMSIIKGDAKSISIAAASIIAKVTRDRLLVQMDKIYPGYGFSKHKGYGTREHVENIKKLGVCEIHRKSFLKNIIGGLA